jgi:regulator of RNase E activity RraA
LRGRLDRRVLSAATGAEGLPAMTPTLPAIDELRRLLYTPVLSDVLDSFGLMRQAVRPFVRPLDEALVLFGRVRTGRYVTAATVPPAHNPYALELDLIDDLKPGEVPVLACGGPTDWIAPWGELLSTAARARGAAGCVTDGLVRDVARIRAMHFPVFHGGIGPLDTKGRAEMIEKDMPVDIAGVRVAAGDWVMGDVDGVVFVPADRADAVFRAALDKIAAEDSTRAELEAGESLHAVYARHGVL